MKKATTNLAILSIIIFFASCQKEPSGELPTTNASDRVKTYTEDYTWGSTHIVDSVLLSYDANNRIISLKSVTGDEGEFKYSYPNTNTVFNEQYQDGVLQIHSEEYLANNHIDSMYQYNNEGDTSTARYIFNAAGEMTQQREYDYTKATGSVLFLTTNYTYDANNNALKEEDTDGNSVSYEYYSDKKYYHPLIGPLLTPQVKRYLIKTIKAVQDGETEIGDVTYTFDSSDRVTSETTVTDQGAVIIKRYTYY